MYICYNALCFSDVTATIWIRCYNQEISPTLKTQLRAKLDDLCVGTLTEDEQENSKSKT